MNAPPRFSGRATERGEEEEEEQEEQDDPRTRRVSMNFYLIFITVESMRPGASAAADSSRRQANQDLFIGLRDESSELPRIFA